MAHIVLLGDSIFDNASYTKGRPAVISQVRQLLPTGWQASLLAVDGATTEKVPSQLQRLPPDASHLVLSVEETTLCVMATSSTGRLILQPRLCLRCPMSRGILRRSTATRFQPAVVFRFR